jgi:hypothetical protein
MVNYQMNYSHVIYEECLFRTLARSIVIMPWHVILTPNLGDKMPPEICLSVALLFVLLQ